MLVETWTYEALDNCLIFDYDLDSEGVRFRMSPQASSATRIIIKLDSTDPNANVRAAARGAMHASTDLVLVRDWDDLAPYRHLTVRESS